MSTVGVFGCQFGGWYEDLVPGWFESVLSVGADQIVFVSDRHWDVPDGVTLVVMNSVHEVHPAADFLNVAVSTLTTDWCWPLDVDDRLRPDCLDMIVDDADVVAVGMLRSDGVSVVPKSVSAEWVLQSKNNPVNACSPFRRWVWEATGGYPNVGFWDWGFWRLAAKAEAKFVCSGGVAYDYRLNVNSHSHRMDTNVGIAEVMAL